MKNKSGRLAHMPKKYNDFEMMALELSLLQIEMSFNTMSELLLIGSMGMRFKHTSELHIMNYIQAMESTNTAEW